MSELTLTEAATRLGVSASTLRHQVRNGQLRARIAGKTYLVAPEEVDRYATESRGRIGRPARRTRATAAGAIALDRDALAKLAARWQIRSIAAFGSVVRGEARADSDIDLVMQLEPGASVGLFDHARIAEDLAPLFGRRVDLVTWASLRPSFADNIQLEGVDLLAR